MSSEEIAPETDTEIASQSAESSGAEPKGRSPYASFLIVGSLICIAGSVYYIMQSTKERRDGDGMTQRDRAIRDRDEARKKEQETRASFKTPGRREEQLYGGVENLQMTAAQDAKLEDEARVIGIAEGGKPRAYVLAALSYKDSHIVHDSIGKAPLTITYCNNSDNARVFLRTIDTKKFRMVGIEGQNMELVIDGKHYAQTAKDIPLQDFQEFTICKWAEWKTKHPKTTLYAGKNKE